MLPPPLPPAAHFDLDASLKPTSGIKLPPRPQSRSSSATPAPPTVKKPQQWKDKKAAAKKPAPAAPAGPGAAKRLMQGLGKLAALRPSPQRTRTLGKIAAVLVACVLVLGGAAGSYYLVVKGMIAADLNGNEYKAARQGEEVVVAGRPVPVAFADEDPQSWLNSPTNRRRPRLTRSA